MSSQRKYSPQTEQKIRDCNNMYKEYQELRVHYNFLKRDNGRFITKYKESEQMNMEFKRRYEELFEQYEILKNKFNSTVAELRRNKKEQIRTLNEELRTLPPTEKKSPTLKFSPSAKTYSTHKVLNQPSRK